jgi:hypothetical protein
MAAASMAWDRVVWTRLAASCGFSTQSPKQLPQNVSPPQGSALRTWLSGVSAAFSGRVLAFTEVTAPVCASLHIPNPRSDRDAMIAATAMEHGFTVVTRNELDFIQTGVTIINPWNS